MGRKYIGAVYLDWVELEGDVFYDVRVEVSLVFTPFNSILLIKNQINFLYIFFLYFWFFNVINLYFWIHTINYITMKDKINILVKAPKLVMVFKMDVYRARLSWDVHGARLQCVEAHRRPSSSVTINMC